MEEKERNRRFWIVVALIGGLVVGCIVGALAGGAVGYWAGKRVTQERAVIEPFRFRVEPEPLPEGTPVPEFELPRMMQGGALVLWIEEDGPADRAGLRVGDLIVEVDGEPLKEGENLAERISDYDPGDEVELTVIRGEQERMIEVELGEQPGRRGQPWLGIEYRDMPTFQFRFEGPGQRSFPFPWSPSRRD